MCYRNPTNLQESLLNVAIWSQFTSDCLWASSWLTKDHEDFKRMAMNRSFPRTQDLILSVRRQVKTLIERTDAYNKQKLQDWNTFRWSRITLLSDPAATLIRMKVHVFSDSTLCVGVWNPDPSNKWATKIRGRMEGTRIWRQLQFGSPRSAIHVARTTRCFHS